MSALREIIARFGVYFDTKELEKGHKHVESTIGKLKELGETVLAAFAIEKVAEFGKELLESAEHLKATSIALGTTTDELQGLDHAADQSSVGVDALHSALARLQRGAADASTKGTSPAAAGFKKLGIALKDDHGNLKTSGALFTDVADKIADIKNPTERAGVANSLFGRSYAQLLPLLLKGKDGIAELTGEVKELGFGMDDAFIENSEEVLHNTDRLKKGLRGLAIQAIGPLLPDLAKLTEKGVELTRELIPLIKHTEAFKAGLALLTGKGVAALLGKLAGGGGLIGVLKTLGAFALETLAPFLLLEDAFVFLSGGKSVTGDLLDKAFGKGTAKRVLDDIHEISDDFNTLFSDAGNEASGFGDKWDDTVRNMSPIASWFFGGITKDFDLITGLWGGFGERGQRVLDGLRLDAEAMVARLNPLNFSKSWDELRADAWKDLQTERNFTQQALQDTGAVNDDNSGRVGVTTVDEPVRQGTTVVTHAHGKPAPLAQQRAAQSQPLTATAIIPQSWQGGGDININSKPQVHLVVQQGTSAQQTREIAAAVQKGVEDANEDLRGTLTALHPTAPPG